MKILFILLATLWIANPPQATINKEEAQKAFLLLQEIRANPEKYSTMLQFPKTLKTSKVTLKWNDTLAKAAEEKALDMARRRYFSHVDPDGYGMNYRIHQAGYLLNKEWIKNKRDNNFESIAMNMSSGEEAIRKLIIDAGFPSKGHRDHLLGVGDWYGSLTDIGIGFAEIDNDGLETYMCILIAKHNW
jgi:hypothetical protein